MSSPAVSNKTFLQRIMDVPRARTISDWSKLYPQVTAQQLDIFYTFLVYGSIGVIEQWVKNGMPEEIPLDLAKIVQNLMES